MSDTLEVDLLLLDRVMQLSGGFLRFQVPWGSACSLSAVTTLNRAGDKR